MAFINTFSKYYRNKYGGPVGKIALDAGLVCPNREKGGCIYCSAKSFTPFYLEKGDAIATQLEKGRAYIKSKKFAKYFSYFQQETTTAAPLDELAPMFTLAASGPDCIGLILSTRPDYLEDGLLDTFAGLSKSAPARKEILIELGLQSGHDRTLELLNRNHSFNDFAETAARIKKHPEIELGVHLILGLPGEDLPEMIETINKVVELGVDYIKLHHLQIIKGTPLQDLFYKEPFKVYGPGEYLEMLAELLGHIPKRIVLHRLWSTADPDLLYLPRWDMFSYELNTQLMSIMDERNINQGTFVD